MTERERIKTALWNVAGVKLVTTDWPKQFNTTPCIVLTMAGEQGADFRDDKEYLTEQEWYVRVFSAKEPELLKVADGAQAAMEELGYARNLRWEEPGDAIRQVAIRMSKRM